MSLLHEEAMGQSFLGCDAGCGVRIQESCEQVHRGLWHLGPLFGGVGCVLFAAGLWRCAKSLAQPPQVKRSGHRSAGQQFVWVQTGEAAY